jgi:hypothetical protein
VSAAHRLLPPKCMASQSSAHRPIWLAADAIAAGEQVAEVVGVPLESLVEFLRLDLKDHAAAADEVVRAQARPQSRQGDSDLASA